MEHWEVIETNCDEECDHCDEEEHIYLIRDQRDDEEKHVCRRHIVNYISNYNYLTEVEQDDDLEMEMIGCDDIKREIDLLFRRIKGQERLEKSGKIKIKKPTLHMIFTGNPGTGKTAYARKMAKQFFDMGYIRKNKVVETDRSGLIGEAVGTTAPKVVKKIKEALGGVLFIDEAHSLFSNDPEDESNTFSHEAVATLLKAMEDHRGNLVVIMAGYEAEMQRMLSTNDGFRSRFNYHLRFRDYTPEELFQISDQNFTSLGYNTDQIQIPLRESINKEAKHGSIPGNARWARNFCDKVIMEHMIRIGEDETTDVSVILPEDVKRASGLLNPPSNPEGLLDIRNQAQAKLDDMVGLSTLKSELNSLMNFLTVIKIKEDQGISTSFPSLHMLFKGAPGTGKTTVARLIGQFLKGTGILANGHLVEVTKADFVSGIVGRTSKNVRDYVQKAIGGVLFIDEAYTLAKDKGGREAIDELIKQMEEYREQFVVIFAGYEKDMDRLLDANEGLRSRIPHHFSFPDYNEEELLEIAKTSFHQNAISLDDSANRVMKKKLSETHVHGNGRWVRNFTEKLILVQSDRIIREKSTDLQTIHFQDVEETFKRMTIA